MVGFGILKSVQPLSLIEDLKMSPMKPAVNVEKTIANFRGKIERSDSRQWVKVCPGCFSINIQPLTSISGTIVHEQWYCPKCDYAGVAIEAKAEDLLRFHLQKLAIQYNKNQKPISSS
jgi:hypothetical protein